MLARGEKTSSTRCLAAEFDPAFTDFGAPVVLRHWSWDAGLPGAGRLDAMGT